MTLPDIQLEKTVTLKNEWCRRFRRTEGTISGLTGHAIGIDPGVNFGVSVLSDDKLIVYHGTLKRETEPGRYGYVAYKFLRSLFVDTKADVCIIEGAAYGAPYGQPLMAEVRTGYYLAMALSGNVKVSIVPPATIRKKVFGDGRFQAMDKWVSLENNAADSLSMVLYAVMKDNGE